MPYVFETSVTATATPARVPQGAKALLRGLDVLELLGGDPRETSFTRIATALRFRKATAHRIVAALEARGYLVRSPAAGGYRLGLKVWQLGAHAVSQLRLRDVARPLLEELGRKTEEHVNLAILDGTDAVFVEIIESAKPIRPYTYVGGRVPAYCSATGKAILAFQPEVRLAAVIRSGLKPFTPRTIVSKGQLRVELRAVRARGYAVNREEWRDDVCGLAAPIWNHESRVDGAVSITTPSSRFDESAFAPLVTGAADAISRAMGWLGEGAAAAPRQEISLAPRSKRRR